MLIVSTISFSQKKDLSPGEFAIYKGLELRSVKYTTDEAKVKEKIQLIQDYVASQDSLKSVHYARAYNYLATLKSYLGSEPDSVSHYAKISFEKHPEWFCKEVIPWQEKSESPDLENVIQPYYLGDSELVLYALMRKFCVQNDWLVEQEKAEEVPSNSEYYDGLKAIEVNSKKETGIFAQVDWESQNRKDEENRVALDELFEAHGFPTRQAVTHDGLVIAFKVLANSHDCEWNKKWIPRIMDHIKEFDSPGIVAYMFDRNFHKEEGRCKDQIAFVEELVEILEPNLVNAMKLNNFLE